jgi:hypothetical protein
MHIIKADHQRLVRPQGVGHVCDRASEHERVIWQLKPLTSLRRVGVTERHESTGPHFVFVAVGHCIYRSISELLVKS